MDQLAQVVIVYDDQCSRKVIDLLNERLLFEANVWYVSSYTSKFGTKLKSLNRFRPNYKSYSLLVYMGCELERINHNLFVEELKVKDLSKRFSTVVTDIVSRIHRFDRLKSTGSGYGSVVVFDLDQTIIDDRLELLHGAVKPLIGAIINRFTYRVLWSHGDAVHVKRALKKHSMEHMWDAVMVRPFDTTETANKSLGMVLNTLNNKFGCWGFSWSVLFDDKKDNSAGDYDEHFVVPLDQSAKFYKQWYTQALDWIDTQACNIDEAQLECLKAKDVQW